ncbi:MAG TPA: hypothetical protein DHW71_15725 [Gammaproteobacteria bacterium]|nr:hypothetical protein [Gammaproteobacteria bacterium]HBF07128.1 hypothetical protein [Gammaproteobacteria bacterium]HCK94443.1 hypothetical protein [Gammaproteobacteria bacterium]|tara:strand:- start:1173 stop:1658 length:486 start_codon:yes stop_codon:yes gene_type:complete
MKLQHTVLEKLGDFLEFTPDEKLLADGELTVDDVAMRVSQLGPDYDSYVVIAAKVTSLFPHNLKSVLTIALSANHCWRGTAGNTFSFDPLTEELFLSVRLMADEVNKIPSYDLGDLVLNLYEATKHWQAVVHQLDCNDNDYDFSPRTAHAMSFGLQSIQLQ